MNSNAFTPLKTALKKRKDISIQVVERAFSLANASHKGQTRKSGEAYIQHPLSVAILLAQNEADQDTIITALLHDTVEDTSLTLDEIEAAFGINITKMVDGVTKISKKMDASNNELTKEEKKYLTTKKWMNAICQNLCIAVIKIADRLHNLRTINAFTNEKKKKRIANETLNIFTRFAQLLSLGDMRKEMEDLCIKAILPEEKYEELLLRLANQASKGETFVKYFTKFYNKENPPCKPTLSVYPYSSHKTYLLQRKRYSQKIIFCPDLYCIVPHIQHCYAMLEFLQEHFVINHIKNFILKPRSNGYKAIHVHMNVEGMGEVRLRLMTRKMQTYQKRGVTTFCCSNKKFKVQKTFPWIKTLREILQYQGKCGKKFQQKIEKNLFADIISSAFDL